MNYTLAIDQSTSATKVMLFDDLGQLHSKCSADHGQFYPRPGWVEHDAEEILQNTYRCVSELVKSSGLKPESIRSIAVTNQRETVVVWDKRTGKPVYNAIVWQCNRGSSICDRLIKEGHESMVRVKTGLIINPYFSASGIQWILDEVPGARKNAETGNLLFGTIDTWLIWNFTQGAEHVTDYTNASRTLLFNINTLEFDTDLLELFHIPASMAPEALPCDSVFGTTTMNGCLPYTPIAGVMGDSHGALAGQMCFAPGMGKATYGTGSSIMVNIGEKPLVAPAGLMTSVGFAAGGKIFYAYEGNIHCTGATIKWLQDELGLISSAVESEALATSVDGTGGVYLVPAFAGLGAPWWDSDAKGLICGMTRGTSKAHVVRAALESIAYQVKDLVALMESTGVPLQELRVDGGPVQNRFLMQFQADMLRAAINRSPIEEASALGAVWMGGLALGVWNTLEEIAALRTGDDRIEPAMEAADVARLHEGWKTAVRRTLMKA